MMISRVSRQLRVAIRIFGWTSTILGLLNSAEAATRTAASAAFADVSAAVASAQRGDTVKIPPGSSDWGKNTLLLTKGVKLIGAGRESTSINGDASATLIQITPDNDAQAKGDEFRIEGFHFQNASVFLNASMKSGLKLVVGWNSFINIGGTVFSTRGQTRGVIYKNDIDRCGRILLASGYDTIDEWLSFPFAYGAADNFFFEDNYIHFSSPYNGNGTGWSELGQAGRAVLRYNTWDFANASDMETLDVHGFQNFNIPAGAFGQTGAMIIEFYGNTILHANGFRTITHRGSWGLFFNNIITGTGANIIHASQYGSTDNGGSGCRADVAAVDPRAVAFNPQVNNTYCFNNTVNGTIRDMTLNNQLPQHCGIAENVDFFNFSNSFDGTVGIGRGTEEPAGIPRAGVGYWKAATPTPTTDASTIQSGAFYKCIAPGTWTLYYKPYTYPHPLTVPRPIAPTALRVVPRS